MSMRVAEESPKSRAELVNGLEADAVFEVDGPGIINVYCEPTSSSGVDSRPAKGSYKCSIYSSIMGYKSWSRHAEA